MYNTINMSDTKENTSSSSEDDLPINYKQASSIKKEFNISTSTLRNWSNQGKIKSIQYCDRGKRYYNIEDVKKLLCNTSRNLNICEQNEKTIIYARVSSNHQKEDLTRQVDELKKKYPTAEVIMDIGSSLNYSRKGLNLLLELVFRRKCTNVAVLYSDRLDRFAFNLFEIIFKNFGVTIDILTKDTEEEDSQAEMADDILNVVNYFVAKNNGLRAAKNKKMRQEN